MNGVCGMRFYGIRYEFLCRQAAHVAVASGQKKQPNAEVKCFILLTNTAAECVKYLTHALCEAQPWFTIASFSSRNGSFSAGVVFFLIFVSQV